MSELCCELCGRSYLQTVTMWAVESTGLAYVCDQCYQVGDFTLASDDESDCSVCPRCDGCGAENILGDPCDRCGGSGLA